jgi:hypothetical protein
MEVWWRRMRWLVWVFVVNFSKEWTNKLGKLKWSLWGITFFYIKKTQSLSLVILTRERTNDFRVEVAIKTQFTFISCANHSQSQSQPLYTTSTTLPFSSSFQSQTTFHKYFMYTSIDIIYHKILVSPI